jgi:hypothetical protein
MDIPSVVGSSNAAEMTCKLKVELADRAISLQCVQSSLRALLFNYVDAEAEPTFDYSGKTQATG